MPCVARPVRGRCVLSLVSLMLLLACSEEESAPVQRPPSAKAKKEKVEGGEKYAATGASAIVPPPPWPAVKPVEPATLREGAPVVFAQYAGSLVVPVASRRGETWTVEELQALESLPQTASTAVPEPLMSWWNRLDIQDGDVFVLRGDRGAEGTLTVRREFASLDRGGCLGQVWAVPGKVAWKVRPKKAPEDSDGPAENVWALRGFWTPSPVKLARDLSAEELTAGRRALAQTRSEMKKSLPKSPGGAKWQSCDSLTQPPCTSSRIELRAIDLEGDGIAEALTSIQFRSVAGGDAAEPGRSSISTIEARVLLGLTQKDAYVLGRWNGVAGKSDDDALPAQFTGLIDLSGDGRAELIMSRTVNEATNWEVLQASPDTPGTWTTLFKTAYQGC